MRYDLIIVGAGMTGLMAAAKVSEQGKKVLVLAKGHGSLALSSGTIDLSADAAKLKKFVAENNEHPYAKVGIKDILEALEFIQKISIEMGYPYLTLQEVNANWVKGQDIKNFFLPTAFGTVKPSYLAPRSFVKGDLRQAGDTLILGFKELRDFSPELIAANLHQIRQIHSIPGKCRGVKVDLKLGSRALNAFELATLIDSKEIREKTIKVIKEALKPYRLNSKLRLGVPAVLGTASTLEIYKEFEEELKVELFEIPTLQPSVGGTRMQGFLQAYLKKQGTKVLYSSQVVGVRTEKYSIKQVLVDSAGGRLTSFNTENLLLATGGIYGGGIESTIEGFQEKICQLPLVSDDCSSETSFLKESPSYVKVGVKVDSNLRPAKVGDVVYNNLFVAGRSLAGYDPVMEKSGHGVAIATAYKVSKEIVAQNQVGGEQNGIY